MSDARIAPEKLSAATPASKLLRDLASSHSGPVTLGTVLAAMGSRAHGLALVLLALPDTLPLPVPSTSLVLGFPLVMIAGHMVLYGEGSKLPARAAGIAIPRAIIAALARYAAPVLQVLEKLSRPRWLSFVQNDRMLGLLCLYLSILLLLPIPLFNAAPSICLVAIALGMVHRDGLMVAVGVIGTALVTVALVYFGGWVGTIFRG